MSGKASPVGETNVPQFSTNTGEIPVSPSRVVPAEFQGRRVQHKRMEREGDSVSESELTEIPSRVSARAGHRAIMNIQGLFQELTERTKQATKEIQYLRTRPDPSDPKSVSEAVVLCSDMPCSRKTSAKGEAGTCIHADYISDVGSNRTFIVSRYLNDVPLFWKFFVEHKFDIVDLVNDRNRYVPSNVGMTKTFGDISVRLISKIHATSDLSVCLYEVQGNSTHTTQSIRRLEFRGWQQDGTLSLETLRALVAQLETAFSGDILIHCPARIGRAGTIISAYFLKQQVLLRQISYSNLGQRLVELIVRLRQQGMARFVQNKEQFSLLIDFGHDLLSRVPLRGDSSDSLCVLSEEDLAYQRTLSTPLIESVREEDCSETLRFSPRLSIPLKERASEEMVENIFEDLQGTKIRFDASTKTLHFGYGAPVVLAFSQESSSLSKIVGRSYRTIFDGYINSFAGGVKYARSSFDSFVLLENAKDYFARVVLPARIPFSLPSSPTEHQLITSCLENRPGICIGEKHSNGSPKDFLCEHLSLLVSLGVTTLFIEHLPSESLQDELDQFLAGPPHSSMPPALSIYLDYLTSGFRMRHPSHGFKEVIVAAKAAGIRHIVCIDTEETYAVGTTARDGVVDRSKRIMAMNYNAAQLINAHKDAGKYIVFAGGTHITTYGGIPGLAQLTGCVSLLIQDTESQKEVGIQRDVTIIERDTFREDRFLFDVQIKRTPV